AAAGSAAQKIATARSSLGQKSLELIEGAAEALLEGSKYSLKHGDFARFCSVRAGVQRHRGLPGLFGEGDIIEHFERKHMVESPARDAASRTEFRAQRHDALLRC